MTDFNPLRALPEKFNFTSKDVIVIYGEVFSRGYITGLIEAAQRAGAKVVYSTVGRRDKEGQLRALSPEEIAEKSQSPLINIPLEAGFDMEASDGDKSPVEQLANVKLKAWPEATLDWSSVEKSKALGTQRFVEHTKHWVNEVSQYIEDGSNVLFVHTMAGGIPRAKIVMPVMNRVFKGQGDRYLSSLEMWNSEIGKLCDLSFTEVTAITYKHLIEQTEGLRSKIESNGGKVRYTAYGYHGTELFIGDELKWQSFSPYLQGFAKMQLEEIAIEAAKNSINASVFNAPEILTNSSSVFLGIEIALYQLLFALKDQSPEHSKVKALLKNSQTLLKDEFTLSDIFAACDNYFSSDLISNKWSHYNKWPQHNGPEQMALMHETSKKILSMHKSEKELLVADLSEIIFQACGFIMLHAGWNEPAGPVCWMGHDQIINWYVN